MRGERIPRSERGAAGAAALALLLASCAPGASPGAAARDGAPAPPRPEARRALIIPRIDHHQHIVGPAAVIPGAAQLPAARLPAELDRVLQARNRVAETGDAGDLYAEDARVLDWSEDAQPWVRGRAEAGRVAATYPAGSRFVPNGFAVDDSVAHVTGVVRAASPHEGMNFSLGLRKGPGGVWRIATEHATLVPRWVFDEPLTAERLIRDLDEAGIERAVVLSVAYFFGSPNRSWPGDEYANARAENDWVAAQVARYPDRLVAFCGIAPLREYAVRELRRCRRELGMRGIKMHFRSGRVDVTDPEHLRRVQEVFRAANELGMAIVVHSEQRGEYGREHAEVFLDQLLPAAPDVPVQIAHLWGGNQFRPAPLAVFADAVAAGDPRTKNLYFDLTEVEPGAGGSPGAMAEIARRLRQIGLDRILYGSDAPATPDGMTPVGRWARLRRALPLTDDELRVIAGNVAPYMR